MKYAEDKILLALSKQRVFIITEHKQNKISANNQNNPRKS